MYVIILGSDVYSKYFWYFIHRFSFSGQSALSNEDREKLRQKAKEGHDLSASLLNFSQMLHSLNVSLAIAK